MTEEIQESFEGRRKSSLKKKPSLFTRKGGDQPTTLDCKECRRGPTETRLRRKLIRWKGYLKKKKGLVVGALKGVWGGKKKGNIRASNNGTFHEKSTGKSPQKKKRPVRTQDQKKGCQASKRDFLKKRDHRQDREKIVGKAHSK